VAVVAVAAAEAVAAETEADAAAEAADEEDLEEAAVEAAAQQGVLVKGIYPPYHLRHRCQLNQKLVPGGDRKR